MQNKSESLTDNRGIFLELIPGVVHDHDDPKQLGRIKIKLENNDNIITGWMRPTLPGLGYEHGIWIIPQPGDYVLCLLKQGHPDFGFWIGGFGDVNQRDTKGKGATNEPAQTSDAENAESEKIDFGANDRHQEGGEVQDNIIIKHRNGSKVILYDNKDILIENNFVTHWILNDGTIQTTSSSPADDGTYYIEEDGIKKGYQHKVSTDGSINQFNPHHSHTIDKDGNIVWRTDADYKRVIEKNVNDEIHGDFRETVDGKHVSQVKGNVTMDHKGNVTWKIAGDLNIEVSKGLKIKSKDADITAVNLKTLGSKSAEHKSGLQLINQSPMTQIN